VTELPSKHGVEENIKENVKWQGRGERKDISSYRVFLKRLEDTGA